MSVEALAKRYAQAFCGLVHEEGDLDNAIHALEILSEQFDDALDVVFTNPDVSKSERHQLLDDVFATQETESNSNWSIIERFCHLLVDKDRFRYFPEIVDACRDESDRILGRKRAAVDTPFNLDDRQRNQLKQKLANRFDADILLEETHDPELLAGLKIQIEDYLMDHSIRKQIKDFYEKFG